ARANSHCARRMRPVRAVHVTDVRIRENLRRNTMHHCFTKALAAVTAAAITLLPARVAFAADQDDFKTATPIKHVVVIFQENVSFDHYFGTYPHAKKNTDGTSYFRGAKADT